MSPTEFKLYTLADRREAAAGKKLAALKDAGHSCEDCGQSKDYADTTRFCYMKKKFVRKYNICEHHID